MCDNCWWDRDQPEHITRMIRPSPRRVKCGCCDVKIERGELRIEAWWSHRARPERDNTHPRCYAHNGCGASLELETLIGWTDLSDEDRARVSKYFDVDSWRFDSHGNSYDADTTDTDDDDDTSSASAAPSRASSSATRPSVIIPNPQSPGASTSGINQGSAQEPVIDLTQPSSPSISRSSSDTSAPSSATNGSTHHFSQTSQSRVSRQSSSVGSRNTPGSYLSQGPTIDLTLDHDDDHDDDDSTGGAGASKRPRLERDRQGRPVMPDLLAGVNIPDGPGRDGDECSVCLDPPLHPVTLPCGHVNCFTCAKGLTRQGGGAACSLCRQSIPHNFLDDSQVISEALEDVVKDDQDDGGVNDDQQKWTWFYEGRNGWWRFEERNNDEIEETHLRGAQNLETLICGNLYVIDLVRMEQYQKHCPNRKRKIKRDLQSCDSKGIAGLASNKLKK